MRPPVKEWEKFGKAPDPESALKSGDIEAALSGFATRHLLDYRMDRVRVYSDHDICGFGVALWLAGDSFGAAAVWARACEESMKGRYTLSTTGTFQTGLLLWFASVWLEDEDWHGEAEALFDKLLRRKHPVMGADYPSLLARLLRREIDLPQIEAQQSNVSHLRERQQSQALFYAGVRSFEEKRADETAQLWQRMRMPENSLIEFEYYLLAHERKRLCV